MVLNEVQTKDSSDEYETSKNLRTQGSIINTANRPCGSCHIRDRGQKQKEGGTPKKITSPRNETPKPHTSNGKGVVFIGGADYVQVDISGFDTAVSKHFVDVSDKLRRINRHSKSISLVADAQGITIDEFHLQSLSRSRSTH